MTHPLQAANDDVRRALQLAGNEHLSAEQRQMNKLYLVELLAEHCRRSDVFMLAVIDNLIANVHEERRELSDILIGVMAHERLMQQREAA